MGGVILPPATETYTVTLNCDWYNNYAYTDKDGVGVIGNNGHATFEVLKDSFLILHENNIVDGTPVGAVYAGSISYARAWQIVADAYFKYSM